MISLQSLRNALLDLLRRLDGTEVKLIIGGGFGIFLKTEHVRAGEVRTLIAPEAWPEARSTNDIDLFLRPELLIASEKLKPLASAISYEALCGTELHGETRAFGMEVIAHDIKPRSAEAARLGFAYVSFDELLRRSHFLGPTSTSTLRSSSRSESGSDPCP